MPLTVRPMPAVTVNVVLFSAARCLGFPHWQSLLNSNVLCRQCCSIGFESLIHGEACTLGGCTVEDVLNVIEMERPEGIIVQFGGQTPLKLATAPARNTSQSRPPCRPALSGAHTSLLLPVYLPVHVTGRRGLSAGQWCAQLTKGLPVPDVRSGAECIAVA